VNRKLNVKVTGKGNVTANGKLIMDVNVNGKGNVNENVNTNGNVKWECGWELEYCHVNVIANAIVLRI